MLEMAGGGKGSVILVWAGWRGWDGWADGDLTGPKRGLGRWYFPEAPVKASHGGVRVSAAEFVRHRASFSVSLEGAVEEDSPPLADPFPGLASSCRSPPVSAGQRNSFFGKPTPRSPGRSIFSGKPSKGVRPCG